MTGGKSVNIDQVASLPFNPTLTKPLHISMMLAKRQLCSLKRVYNSRRAERRRLTDLCMCTLQAYLHLRLMTCCRILVRITWRQKIRIAMVKERVIEAIGEYGSLIAKRRKLP